MDLPAFLFVDQPALLPSYRGSISHFPEQQDKKEKKIIFVVCCLFLNSFFAFHFATEEVCEGLN